jgi:hypothetical protein
MRWAVHLVCTGDRKVAYRVLVGKHEGQIRLGRQRLRLEDTIKMDLEMA